jgi:hypothetical protein
VPDLRGHASVRRHPVILAVIARHTVTGTLEGARQGYRTARSELGEAVPPHAVDSALKAYRDEGRRLATAYSPQSPRWRETPGNQLTSSV